MATPTAARIAATMALAVSLTARFAVAGQLIDLGTLGGYYSWATDINEAGQIVGVSDFSETVAGWHAFLYSGGVMTDLGDLGVPSGAFLEHMLINDSGQLAGSYVPVPGVERAFFYNGGVRTDLSTPGFTTAYPTRINDAGQILGIMYVTGSSAAETHTFFYSGGVLTDLGTNVLGWDMNESGVVTGIAGATHHAFVFAGGVMTDLGAFGGSSSTSLAINNSGAIAGSVTTTDEVLHSLVYSNGSSTDLGAFGLRHAFAVGINASGQVLSRATKGNVGSYEYYQPEHGILTTNGSSVDLGGIGGTYLEADLLNDAGQVAGLAVPPGVTVDEYHGPQVDGHVFLYSAGSIRDLGTLGRFTIPSDLNHAGQVIGWSGTGPLSNPHAFLRNPECGDGILDPGEDCDDGNTRDGDCCQGDCTYTGPSTMCIEATEAALQIKHNVGKDQKDKLQWVWTGDPIDQADLGSPSTVTSYNLCISDSTGGADRLVASLLIDPNADWTDRSPDGWSFQGKPRIESGIKKMTIATTATGMPQIKLQARGTNVPMPSPFSGSEFFDQDTRVTVQLFNSTTGNCWSSEFTSAHRNIATQFKASAP